MVQALFQLSYSPEGFRHGLRAAARSAEWGREGLEARIADAWHPYVSWTEGWLRVEHEHGGPALVARYLELLEGRIDPSAAHVLTLQDQRGLTRDGARAGA